MTIAIAHDTGTDETRSSVAAYPTLARRRYVHRCHICRTANFPSHLDSPGGTHPHRLSYSNDAGSSSGPVGPGDRPPVDYRAAKPDVFLLHGLSVYRDLVADTNHGERTGGTVPCRRVCRPGGLGVSGSGKRYRPPDKVSARVGLYICGGFCRRSDSIWVAKSRF